MLYIYTIIEGDMFISQCLLQNVCLLCQTQFPLNK